MVLIPDNIRTLQTAATVGALDNGVGTPSLVIGTAGMATELIVFPLDGTNAFTATTPGVATLTGAPISAVALNSGDAGAYEYRDRNGGVVWSGTSITGTNGGGEIEISNTAVVAGNTNDLVNGSYTSPAS